MSTPAEAFGFCGSSRSLLPLYIEMKLMKVLFWVVSCKRYDPNQDQLLKFDEYD